MARNFPPATLICKAADPSPLESFHRLPGRCRASLAERKSATPMSKTSKPPADSESEKDRLRQKLLRLIVQSESRRSTALPHQPQLKR